MPNALRHKTVLVVDDDIGMFPALTKVLISEGCTVAGATDPMRAVEYLVDTTQAFDLIVTDLRMPGLDGIEVLELVKRTRPRIPVIIITAYSTDEAQAEALRLGAAAYLEKPIATTELIATVRRVLAAAEPVRQAPT